MRQGWFLVPIFAPFLGTIVGTMIYQLMVGFHVEGEVRDRKEEEERNVRLTNVSSKEENKDTYWVSPRLADGGFYSNFM